MPDDLAVGVVVGLIIGYALGFLRGYARGLIDHAADEVRRIAERRGP